MLGLPAKGLAASTNKHNVDLCIFCDWIEASALFLEKEVTGSDLVDLLIENNVYKNQDFAWELVNDALSLFGIRAKLIGDGYPFLLENDCFSIKDHWKHYTPYAFCLMLSLAKSHNDWIRATFGADYTAQGALFEELTAEAVTRTFPGWKVHATGWTSTRTNKIHEVVTGLCAQLNEGAGEVLRWTKDTAKEAGLDLVTYKPFADGNVGIPVFLWQCASGMDWVKKQKTPDLALWQRIVTWAVTPRKALSMPFALSDKDMRQHSVIVEGLLLDRHRLLEPGMTDRDWVSVELRNRIIAWLEPRIAAVPRLAA